MAQGFAKKQNLNPIINNYNYNTIYNGMNDWNVANYSNSVQWSVTNDGNVAFTPSGMVSISFSNPYITFDVPATLSSYTNDAGFIGEAPYDSNYYVRQNDAWIIAPFITDAPADGMIYGRQNNTWVATSAGITFQTNGTNNGSQTLLNLVAGTNMTITDNGSGSIIFDASGGGGGTGINSGLRYTDGGGYGSAGGSYWDGSSTLYINRYDYASADNYAYLSNIQAGDVIVYHGRTTTDYFVFYVNSSTWTGSYFYYSVTVLGSAGSVSGVDVGIDFERRAGDTGATGSTGANGLNSGFRYTDVTSSYGGSGGQSYYDGSANIYFNRYGSSGEDNFTYFNSIVAGDTIIYKGRTTTDYIVFLVSSVSWNGTYFTFNGSTTGGTGSPTNMDVGIDFEMINGTNGSNGADGKYTSVQYPLYEVTGSEIGVYYVDTGQDGVLTYAEYLAFVAKLDDAPNDGIHYDRQSASWVNARIYPYADKTISDNGYTVVINSDYFQKWDVSGGSSTTYLPTVASSTGMTFIFKKIDSSANILTIQAQGGENIDGSNTYVITSQGESITLFSNGTEYSVI